MTVAAQLNAICDAQPFVTRFMVRNLLTGEEIGRGENEETPSGSTRKTSIMMAVLKAASEGRIDLDQPVTYEKRLAEEVASGMFRYMTPGIVISLRDAVAGMMVLSDNVCTKMVFERLTLDEGDTYCKSIGMTGRQLKAMLVYEGLFYALGAAVISLVLTLALGPVAFTAVGSLFWFFTYRLTLTPFLIVVPVFALLGVLVPLAVYRSVSKSTIVERLREVD